MAFKNWWSVLKPYAGTFMLLQLVTRIFFIVYSGVAHDVNPVEIGQMLAIGTVFDLQVLGFFIVPLVLIHMLRAEATIRTGYKIFRFVSFSLLTYVWIFGCVAEFFFWQEFSTRFNFIAVDYLIYTTEVLGNIRESYPLPLLLSAIGAGTLALTWIWRRALQSVPATSSRTMRNVLGLALMSLPVFGFFVVHEALIPSFHGVAAAQEISKNGVYALFSAYRHNELDYKSFYMTRPETDVTAHIRDLLKETGHPFESSDPDTITRMIQKSGPELHKNVVMIVIESLSGAYLKAFGNTQDWTPNIERLAHEGLFFTDLYATGTRTVRGLEALSLSVPPTPGQSIMRRPNNGDLATLGSVFADRGYDTAFIYGGHGYFDNMNAYFSANGFRIVDRMNFTNDQVRFSNVWGVCDQDLFGQVIAQADVAHQQGKPFFYMVMTTSNHRPYTFPEGIPGIPSKNGGRAAGVKYTDYAIGELIEKAKQKDWFKNTVFIFVADHTAGAGGKTELSLEKYHIPAIFYSPGFIAPQRYEKTASQIDVGPTLLGLLNFSYRSKFFGRDVLAKGAENDVPRAFISNYQKVSLLQGGRLMVLEPKKLAQEYKDNQWVGVPGQDDPMLVDAITYYQYASGWRERMKKIPTVLHLEDKK